MIKTSKFIQILKAPLKLFAHFMLILLNGYGWRAFLARLVAVAISFMAVPFDFAVHQSATAPMKLFLFTYAFLAYAILMLVLDYTKRGKEFEAKRREAKK